MAPGMPWLSIRDATLTASPSSVCLRPPCVPISPPHTTPTCAPASSRTTPSSGCAGSMIVEAAAAIAATAKRARITA